MATAANLTYSGNKIAEDFHNTISDISPTDTPFVTMAKRFKAQNTLHQWTYDALNAAATNAALEGAGFFRRQFSITLPQILPTAFLVLVLAVVNAFKIFKEVYVIGGA